MVYKILAIQLNTKKGNYDGHKVIYQPPAYKGQVKDPVERFVFSNSDVARDVIGLQVGDTVEITFDDTKWKNPTGFTVVQDQTPSSTPPWEDKKPSFNNANKDDAIARAVAIKEASNVLLAQANNGAYTAANLKKREFLVQEILQSARELLPFLTNTETFDAVDASIPSGCEVPNEEYND